MTQLLSGAGEQGPRTVPGTGYGWGEHHELGLG